MNKRIKLENGITLIALIITIIVLLILAGVTIATLTGENGILNKAEKSKEQTIIAREKEEIALAYNAVKLKNKGGNVTAEELETELKEKAKVIENNNKLIVTYKETGNKYYITQDEKIEKLEGENTEIDIQVGDIIFTYSIEGEEYNESKWTNKNVKVTAKINEEKITNNGDYEIQITRTPDIEESWKTETVEEFTTNGTLYARLIDTFERKTKSTLSTNVTNIDKDTPIIENVTGSTSTANSGSIIVSSILDTGGSGLSGIYISTSSTTPSEDASEWENNTESSYTKTVSSNGTYYVWVKDAAGNVSNVKSCTVSGIVAKVTAVKLTSTTVNKGSTVTISKTLTGSTSYKSIAFTSSNTGVATIVSGTGKATGLSVGTTTITCTVTNYDGTTIKGTCTLTVKSTELYDNVKIGDYVAYDATNDYAYGNIKTSSDIKWRVFSKDSTKKQIILISEGAIGNITVIEYSISEKLYESCKIFGYGIGAEYGRSFSEEDFCNFMGWGLMDGPAWVDFGEMTNSSHRLSKEEIELIYIKAEYIMDAERTICRGNETLHPYIYGTYLGDLDEGDYLSYPQLCRYYTLSVDHGDGTGTGYYIDTRIRPVVHLKNTVKTTGKDENGAWIIVDE